MTAFRTPWDSGPPPAPGSAPDVRKAEDDAPAPPKPRGRRPRRGGWATPETAPDFIYCELIVTGPAEAVASFAAAARGPGVTPWALDFDAIEEDIFNLAMAQPPAQRSLTVAGCRVLARQFRARIEARHGQAAVLRSNRSGVCPFDLHNLLPVLPEILRLGPAHPAALAWLRRQWGPPEGLRKIVALETPRPGKRLPADHAVISYGFFSRERPPAAAIATIAATWPALTLRLRHQFPAPGGRWIG